jgi:ABC-2 type transport system ATP-binding protein
MSVMIEAVDLKRNFGDHVAVDGISFKVKKGEVLGFLGPNGAGKSTTMKMLTSFLTPTSGRATVAGFDTQTQMTEVQRRLGYLPENAPIYGEMTVKDFLTFIAEVRGISKVDILPSLERVINQTTLNGVLNQKIETLSKGFKRRVGLAQAIIHDPEVLILDEPTDGLDPNQKFEVRKLIKSMSKDKCIIVSTHILEEVDAICTRALIISKGKVMSDGTPIELKRKSQGLSSMMFDFVSHEDAQRAEKILLKIDSVKSVEILNSRAVVVPKKAKMDLLKEALQILDDQKIPVLDVYSETAHLDEVFRSVTSSSIS